MKDLGMLSLNAAGDLSRLLAATDGYSSVRRGIQTLYPVVNADDSLYFSRSPVGDGADGNHRALVNYRDAVDNPA